MKQMITRIAQNIGLIVISLGLLYGGVAIIRTQIPFWSLLYGLPAVFLGISMSLISFNEIAKNRTAKATEYHQIPCKVCGKMTLAPMLVESIVCADCQYKMALKLQMAALVFFVLLAIPVTMHLAQQAQDLQQNANSPQASPQCEPGKWMPNECTCGHWEREAVCGKGEVGRSCVNVNFCCRKDGVQWNCRVRH